MNNINKFNMNYLENRGPTSPPSKNKFDFKKIKKNTIKSLNDVECFLKDFNTFCRYIKLYKILK